MSTFADAFAAGIRAATEADAALAEIRGVVAEVDRQLHGKYGVHVEWWRAGEWDRKSSLALVREGRPSIVLCGFETSAMGYPVDLRHAQEGQYAADLAELRIGLCAILATSTTGKALHAMLEAP